MLSFVRKFRSGVSLWTKVSEQISDIVINWSSALKRLVPWRRCCAGTTRPFWWNYSKLITSLFNWLFLPLQISQPSPHTCRRGIMSSKGERIKTELFFPLKGSLWSHTVTVSAGGPIDYDADFVYGTWILIWRIRRWANEEGGLQYVNATLCGFTDYHTLRVGGLVFAGVVVVLSVFLLAGTAFKKHWEVPAWEWIYTTGALFPSQFLVSV